MKLLFVHDHIFFSDKTGKIYSAGAYPKDLWDVKYLNHFKSIDVVGRFGGEKKNVDKTHALSSHDKVNFVFVDNLSSIKGLVFGKKKVLSIIKKYLLNSDAVIVRLPSEIGIIVAKLAKQLKKPLAIEVSGCAWDALWNYGTIKAKIYAPILYLRMRKTIKRSRFVLYVTKYFLQKRYPASKNAITTYASNVDLSIFSESVIKKRLEKIKKWYNKPDDKLIFGIIGNYKTKYKGIHTAIKSFSLLRQDLKNFELKILGKGDKKYYHDLAKSFGLENQIIFSGSLPNGDPVLKWLDEVDIYLQPSLQEGLPRSLIEAMSRGCPCIASEIAGIPELLNSEFLHKPGSEIDLSKKIIKMVSNKFLEKICITNFNKAKEYKRELLNRRRSKFYKSLIKNIKGLY